MFLNCSHKKNSGPCLQPTLTFNKEGRNNLTRYYKTTFSVIFPLAL